MCGGQRARTLGHRLNGHQGLRARRKVGITTTVVRCVRCGLIYANPRPVPETIAQHYDRAPEEYWHEAQLAEAGVGVPIDTFYSLWAGARDRPRALDIGAGLGRAMMRLADAGFDVYGLEPSATFRERAIELGADPARLAHAAVEDADYPSGQFDLVSFGAVLEHLHDPAAALERALAWLAPGGLMVAEVPSARWLLGRSLNAVYRLQGSGLVTNLSPMHPPFHLHEFTVESFRLHGLRAGYEVTASRFFPGDPLLPAPLGGLARRLMAVTDTGMQLEVWLRR